MLHRNTLASNDVFKVDCFSSVGRSRAEKKAEMSSYDRAVTASTLSRDTNGAKKLLSSDLSEQLLKVDNSFTEKIPMTGSYFSSFYNVNISMISSFFYYG